VKRTTLQPWALRAALRIYRKLQKDIPLEHDMKKIVVGGWANVIQRAHDDYSGGKRDRMPARQQMRLTTR